jgi:hypothetical protein
MRILAFIEDEEMIEKIIKHLGLWAFKVRPPAPWEEVQEIKPGERQKIDRITT